MDMTDILDKFWESVDALLDQIEAEKPDTADRLIEIMNQYHPPSSNDAFFAGSGGDRQLIESLIIAGWKIVKLEAVYYWVAQHPKTGDMVTYIEGDVARGDVMVA